MLFSLAILGWLIVRQCRFSERIHHLLFGQLDEVEVHFDTTFINFLYVILLFIIMHNNYFFYTSDRQKLFSNEEKVLLNKRVPDLEAAASVSNPYS